MTHLPPPALEADNLAGTVTATSGTTPHVKVPPPTTAEYAGYEILSELGRGGMGVVYKARDLKLNRLVALKVVRGHVDRRELIRFLAEAEAAAAVKHPNVVQVYACGEDRGRPFLVLEYCPGGTLIERLAALRSDPRAAVEVLAKVAAGVAAAHEAGVVHRDLKPSNVLFDEAGEPRVADFGLAKLGTSDLTATGAVMGTPAYMCPEQAEGRTKFVGPQADVWALGVILYEALTGRRPFDGADISEILRRVRTDEAVSIRRLAPCSRRTSTPSSASA